MMRDGTSGTSPCRLAEVALTMRSKGSAASASNPQPWIGPVLPALSTEEQALLTGGAVDAAQRPAPQLTVQQLLPRELTQDEASALLAAAEDDALALCALLLLGLTASEVCGLTAGDVEDGLVVELQTALLDQGFA